MCKTAESDMNVYELSWMTSCQIVLGDDSANVVGWGSGFVLMHGNANYFITADHCIHPKDFEEGTRTGEQNRVFVCNNIINRKDQGNIQTELFKDGWSYCAIIDLKSDIPEILDIIDLAYYKFNKFPYPLYTTELLKEYDGQLYKLCDENRLKFAINSECSSDFSDDMFYIVSGICNNEMRTELLNTREAKVIEDMRFTGYNSEGNAVLIANESLDPDYCSGLSGSPVFDNNGYFVGMLIRVAENNTLTVMPYRTIIEIIHRIEALP